MKRRNNLTSLFSRIHLGIFASAVLGVVVVGAGFAFTRQSVHAQELSSESEMSPLEVLQPYLTFRVPTTVKALLTAAVLQVEGNAIFGQNLTVAGRMSARDLVVSGRLTLNNDITGNNIDIDVKEGKVIASNLVYSVAAGSGMSVSGDQDLVITNNDRGSSQNIFKKIAVGEESFSAGSNDDTLKVAAGSGITVSLDKENKKITISAVDTDDDDDSGGPTALGFTDDGTVVRLITSTDNVGIGTDSPTSKLHVVGNTTLGGTLNVTGTSSLRGILNNGDGITNAGAITGVTGLTSSGTITFSGLSTGIVKSSLAGVLSSSAVDLSSGDVTGILGVTKGGTGLNAFTTGDLLYASGTNTLASLGIGAEDEILTVVSGVPTWSTLGGAGQLCPTCLVTDPGSSQIITPGSSTATGLIVRQASGGSVDIFAVTNNAGSTKYFKVDNAGAVTTGGSLTVNPANTDALVFSPVAQGSAAYAGTITSEDLTAARTWTLPDSSGTFCLTTGNCNGIGGNFGGTGTTNYLSKFTSGTVVGDSLIYDNGTNIGLGTASPTHKLHVVGSQLLTGNSIVGGTFDATGAARLASTLQVSGAGSFLSTLDVTGATTLSSTLGVTGNTTLGGTLGVTGNATFDTNTLYVDATNNRVGIGTTSPEASLHISSGYGGNAAMILNQTLGGDIFTASASGTTRMVLTNAGKIGLGTNSPTATLQFGVNTNGAIPANTDIALLSGKTIRFMGTDGNGDYGSYLSTSYSGGSILSIGTRHGGTDTDAIAIKLGNVGIGTLSPTGKFNVHASSGDTNVLVSGSSASAQSLYLNTSGTSGYGIVRPASAATLQIQSAGRFTWVQNGTEFMRLESTGLLGLGTASPQAKLHISGGYAGNAGVIIDQTLGGDIFTASASGAPKLVLTNAGNLGVGVVSPTSTLQVGGTLAVSGNAAFDTNTLYVDAANDGVGVKTSSVLTTGGVTVALNVNGGIGMSGSTFYSSSGVLNFSNYHNGARSTISTAGINLGLSTNNGGLGYGVMETAATYGYYMNINGSTKVRIDGSTGNVGVGTSTPTSLFHVNGGYGGNAAALINQTLGGDIFTASASGTTQFVITNNGRVGIGTNSPTKGLVVNNTAGALVSSNITTAPSTMGVFAVHAATTTTTAPVFTVHSNVGTSGAEKFRIQADGNIGVGTTTPSGLFHISGGYGGNAAAIIDQTMGGDIFTASSSGTPRLILSNGGNLGIGTIVPTEKLDVTGNAVITNTAATGATTIFKINGANTNLLTVDGLGNMILNGGTGATNGGNILAYAKINSDTVTDIYTATLDRGSGNGGVGLGLGYLFNMESGGGSRTSAGRFSYTWANATAGSEDSTFAIQTKVGGSLLEGLRIHSGSVALGGSASPSARMEITSRYSNYDLQRWTAADGSRLGRLTETSGGHGWFEVDDSSGTAVALLRADGGNSYVSNGNFNIGGTAAGTTANRVLTIANSTAPTAAINNGIQLWAEDVAGSHELRVMDEAGNVTTLSPHNFSMIPDGRSEDLAWSFYSERGALAINADMTKALRLVEKMSGEKLVFIKDLENSSWVEDESTPIAAAVLAQNGDISSVARWSYKLWSFLGHVVFEAPVQFLASVEFKGETLFAGRVTTEDKDAAGFIVIAQGEEEVAIVFEKPFAQKPVIQLTAEEYLGKYELTKVSEQGFTLKVSPVAEKELTFHWTALAVKDAKTIRSSGAPTVAPTASSVPSPTPAVTAEPTPSPSVFPSFEATPSAQATSSGQL